MALASETIAIVIAFLFTYLQVYKKNKLLGNIMYAAIGLTIMAYSTTTTYSAIGIIILIASLINGIFDGITTLKGSPN